jgi:hypothetical protein
VFALQIFLSRRGGGKDTTTTTATTKWKTALRDSARARRMTGGRQTAKALLVSGLPRATRSPRNDGKNHNDDYGKVENGFEGFCACPQNDRRTATAKALLVSGLPRGDKAPLAMTTPSGNGTATATAELKTATAF